MSPIKEILAEVVKSSDNAFRPKMAENVNKFDCTSLIHACWSETLNERPSFKTISKFLKNFSNEKLLYY